MYAISHMGPKTIPVSRMVLFLFLALVLVSQVSLGQNITRPNIEGPSGLQTNSYTGSLFYKRQDLFIPATGLPLDVIFCYNSAERNRDWGFGYGWTFTYNQSYVKDSIGVNVFHADGRQDYFKRKDNGYVAPRGVFDVLQEYETGKLKLTTKAGTEYYFENPEIKKLTRIKDRNRNEITLTYTGKNLESIADAAGRKITFTWTQNRLSQVRAEASSSVRAINYEYNGAGCLVAVKDPLGNQTTYTYAANRALNGLTDGNGNASNISYNSSGAVVKITSCLREQTIFYFLAKARTLVTEQNESKSLLTTYTFDKEGRLVQKAGNCCGYNNEYGYDADNNITRITDANKGQTIYGYDSKGNLLSETDQLGKSIRYTYEAKFNQIATATDKNGNQTSYSYDGRGNLTETRDALGTTQKYTYDDKGKRLSFTDGNGHTILYTYDRYGYLAAVSDAAGGTTVFTHDSWGNVLSYTDPNSNKTSFTYDALNRVLSATDALGGTNRFTYDANGNQLTATDAAGNKTEFAYDAGDKPIYLKDAMGNITLMAYDSQGNMTAKTDANSHTTRYTYDNLNRQVSETNAAQETINYGYDGNGNKTTITHPNGNTFFLQYDALNRVINITDKLGTVAAYTYDANGNKITETDGIGNTRTFTYDARNRLITQNDPLGNSYNYVYDANNNLVKETDRNGNSSIHAYDALNRQINVTDANGGVTAYTYDKAGNLVTVKDANNNITAYTYDPLDRLSEEKFADNTSKSYTYDELGNLLARTDNQGQVTKYIYDNLNRLISRVYPNATETFTFNATGQMLSATNQGATVTFTYDAVGRILSETLNGKTTSYTYNAASGTKIIAYPGGRRIERSMDGRNQLKSIMENNQVIAEFTFNAANQLIGRRYANNTTLSQEFTGNNRVASLSHSPSRFLDLGYTYDKEDNPLGAEHRNRPTQSEQYGYDKLGQLKDFRKGNAQQTQFNYDGVGNRTTANLYGNTATYAITNMNAYSSIVLEESLNLTYDPNGNLTADGKNNFAYDPENRITKVDNRTIARYTYDAIGRRIQKVAGDTTANYYYDGLQLIEERNELDAVVATYVYGTWLDDILSMTRNGNSYYYHHNAIGSVVAITNRAGAVVERYDYDAFGKFIIYNGVFAGRSSSAIQNTFTFTGRQFDAETGLYYYRARYYDPAQGRFLQRDPLGYVDGMGLYGYVKNSPTALLDPMGMMSFCEALDHTQTGLDALGLIPGFGEAADLANALIYLGRGQYGNAAISAMAMIPLAGSVGTGSRLGMKAADGIPKYLYHYTSEVAAESISKTGLRTGKEGLLYLTNKGDLFPLQAQIELALPANRALPTSLLRIDVSNLTPEMIGRVQGNLPGLGAGGGTEYIFNQNIPAHLIEKVR